MKSLQIEEFTNLALALLPLVKDGTLTDEQAIKVINCVDAKLWQMWCESGVVEATANALVDANLATFNMIVKMIDILKLCKSEISGSKVVLIDCAKRSLDMLEYLQKHEPGEWPPALTQEQLQKLRWHLEGWSNTVLWEMERTLTGKMK